MDELDGEPLHDIVHRRDAVVASPGPRSQPSCIHHCPDLPMVARAIGQEAPHPIKRCLLGEKSIIRPGYPGTCSEVSPMPWASRYFWASCTACCGLTGMSAVTCAAPAPPQSPLIMLPKPPIIPL
jgi:hypothetical protein